MLKNTTELGDIASYVAKATKLPRQRSSTIGQARDHHHHRPRASYSERTGGNHVSQSRYHQTRSANREPSLRHNRSLKTNGDYSITSDSQDWRSDSFTQSSSLNSRRISIHPSLRSIRSYGHPGPRPRSPFAYPSRLKRSGYRPSSPAFSEMNRSDSALHIGSHRAYSTRTISPLSNSSHRRAPAVWNHGFNRSDPSLRNHQAVPPGRKHYRNRSPPFVRRGPLRRSPLGSHRSSVISKAWVPKGSGSTSADEQIPSRTPLFYDYSEAFERESFRHTAKRSSMFVARPTPPSDGSSEGYQTDVTNMSNTFAKYSSSSTESKAITPNRDQVELEPISPLELISPALKQHSSEHDKEKLSMKLASTVSQDVPPISLRQPTIATRDPDVEHLSSGDSTELSASDCKMTDPFLVPSASHIEMQYPPSAYNPTPKVIKTAMLGMRLSSSSSGSQYSTSVHSARAQTSKPLAIRVPSMAYERQPKALSVSFSRLGTTRHEAADVEPQQRAASLDTRTRPEPCQIFSPVPERSMSSRDSRDRFSRIFSLVDDFGKRDLFAGPLPNKKAPMTIHQYLRDKKSHSPNTIASSTKELPPLPNDSPPAPNKGKSRETDEPFAILSANEQSNEASKLQEQDDDTFAVNATEQLAALNGFARPGIPPRYSSISRNSLLDQAGPSYSIRASILSQKPSIEQQPRMFPLTKRNSSLYQTMKELPPLPLEPVVAIAPPETPSPLELPYRFTPLMPPGWLDTAVADIQESPKTKVVDEAWEAMEQLTPPRAIKTDISLEQQSTPSPASARPWNLDASYPWAGTPPKLEVSLPQAAGDLAPEVQKLSRFRLKIHRSSVLGNGGRLTKSRPPNIRSVPLPAPSTGMTPVQTRFTEGFEDVQPATPRITLLPPSPGLKFEAQSFFSDDSSHKRHKSILRRRFWRLKSMVMRTTSTDEIKGVERGCSVSAPDGPEADKPSSKQVLTDSDINTYIKERKRKLIDKIKSWFHRHEKKIKVWRSKPDSKKHRSQALDTNV
ncbi:MAG: hypothetical protein Q9213_005119 [Squamulea squamosa]